MTHRDGTNRPDPATRFPAPVIFRHSLLAAGLIVWIVYLTAGKTPLAWAAFIALPPVALPGLAMFARWIGVTAAAAGGRAGYRAAGTTTATSLPRWSQPRPSALPAVPAHLCSPHHEAFKASGDLAPERR